MAKIKVKTPVVELDEADALSPRFLDDIADRFRAATPFMKFLCRATGVPY